MTLPVERGKFLSFEGIDGIGKSTQIQLFAEFLADQKVPFKVIRFPDRTTEIGKILAAGLKKRCACTVDTTGATGTACTASDLDSHDRTKTTFLLFSANRWELNSQIKKWLLEGYHVLCDRHALSGRAYGIADGLSYSWTAGPDLGLVKPDVVFYFSPTTDCPPNVLNVGTAIAAVAATTTATEDSKFDRFIAKSATTSGNEWPDNNIPFLTRVHECYENILKDYSRIIINCLDQDQKRIPAKAIFNQLSSKFLFKPIFDPLSVIEL